MLKIDNLRKENSKNWQKKKQSNIQLNENFSLKLL